MHLCNRSHTPIVHTGPCPLCAEMEITATLRAEIRRLEELTYKYWSQIMTRDDIRETRKIVETYSRRMEADQCQTATQLATTAYCNKSQN
jgi:hypothetical protein